MKLSIFLIFLFEILLFRPSLAATRQKCLDMFEHKANKLVVSEEKNKKTELIFKDQVLISKERLELKGRFSQFPRTEFLGTDYVYKHHYLNNESGDFVTVDFYLRGNPERVALQNHVTNWLQSNSKVLVTSFLSQSQNNTQRNLVTNINELPQGISFQTALSRYISDVVNPDGHLSSSTIEMLVKTIDSNSEVGKAATAYYLRISQDKERVAMPTEIFTLSNFNLNRYFEFTPHGFTRSVPARVLDIHRQNNPYGFVILIEWLSFEKKKGNSDDKSLYTDETTVAVRHIETLSPESFLTIREMTDSRRQFVAESFFDVLSPNEIKTLKVASRLRLHTFGYTDFQRVPGFRSEGESRDGRDPMQEMSNLGHLAIYGWLKEKFHTDLKNLMTNEELQYQESGGYINVLDVMSRLNPRYVLQQFESKGDWEYVFVVTEDGQLKISPHGHRGNNLKPQLLRLAHGRRLFAGGTFFINIDGSLSVELNANQYQDHDVLWTSRNAFETEINGNVRQFLAAVVWLQMGRTVYSINSNPVDVYSEMFWNRKQERYQFYESNPEGFRSDDQGSFSNNSDFQRDYDFSQRKRKSQTSPQNRTNKKAISWNNSPNSKDVPLDFEQWLAKTEKNTLNGIRDTDVRVEWAHYVLQTSGDMSLGDIKKVYKKLVMRFHPDKNPHFAKTNAAQVVNDAFGTIEKDLQ